MEKSDFYVYIYLDPRKPGEYIYDDLKFDYEPFYVGKGKKYRINNGITECLSDRSINEYKKNKMIKIKNSGLEIIHFKLFENLTENEAFKLEIESIKFLYKF